MIIVELAGGLGNQMFQYAAGLCLAKHHSVELKLDRSFLLDRTPRPGHVFRDFDLPVFSIPEIPAEQADFRRINRGTTPFRRFAKRIIGQSMVSVSENQVSPEDFLRLGDDVHLRGYWQDEGYFLSVEEEIRSRFQNEHLIGAVSASLADKIKTSDSVCMNVRRRDFVNNTFHGVCELDYFSRAISKISSVVESPHFFVFSDDIAWCQINLHEILDNFTLVDHQHAGMRFGAYLGLMTLCHHFIIPNSTFAWWAAWLSKCSNKLIIAPKRWFNDPSADQSARIVPRDWVRL